MSEKFSTLCPSSEWERDAQNDLIMSGFTNVNDLPAGNNMSSYQDEKGKWYIAVSTGLYEDGNWYVIFQNPNDGSLHMEQKPKELIDHLHSFGES